ncbi:MAG: XTP/dITP diphosphatase [Syntrophaceae bacterium]|nr:XTP/dITP diphosphatase [Syntrophaceae bacterium]
MEVVIATRNPGKLREIDALLAPLGLRILSLANFPEIPEIIEDGRTFEENAAKKAVAVAAHTGRIAIADDSGLTVDALQGRPGVFSARYAGEGATDAERYRKLLEEMSGILKEKRGAAFVCAIAVSSPEGKTETVVGLCRGEISLAPRGNHGFGYDPVFYLPDLGKTMAELEPEIKNRISHRARALEKLKQVLPNFLKKKQ